MVVVTAFGDHVPQPPAEKPGIVFLLGKVLNTLLLDPARMELESVERMNCLLDELDQSLDPASRRRFDEAVRASRGAAFRKVKVLSFWPNANISVMVLQHLRANLHRLRINAITRWMLTWATRSSGSDADWATFILFDGLLVSRLIELGREDAHRRADEIRAFFQEST
jgi:NTE family protein